MAMANNMVRVTKVVPTDGACSSKMCNPEELMISPTSASSFVDVVEEGPVPITVDSYELFMEVQCTEGVTLLFICFDITYIAWGVGECVCSGEVGHQKHLLLVSLALKKEEGVEWARSGPVGQVAAGEQRSCRT